MICTVVSFLLFPFRSSWLSFFFSYCLSFRFGHIRGAFIVSFVQIFGNKIKNNISLASIFFMRCKESVADLGDRGGPWLPVILKI